MLSISFCLTQTNKMSQINEQFLPIIEDGVHIQYREDDMSPNPTEGIFREIITNNGYVCGPFKQYTKKGKLQIKAQFEYGEFNGKYEEFFGNGNPKLFMFFDNGTAIKSIQTWYPSGNPRSRIPLNDAGRRTGWAEEFFDTDKHRIPHTRVKYVDGDKHGPAYKFSKYGRPLVKANYENDQLHGEYESFYENNIAKVKCTFNKGQLDGKYVCNYSNGNIKRVIYFKNGLPTGRAFFYRLDAKVRTSCAFEAGKLHGAYHSFNTEGKLVEHKKYEHNQLVANNAQEA